MNLDGTLWVSLPVGWMDGMAVGLRRVGRKVTRPRLVKGLSLVKAYAKSYGTGPPQSIKVPGRPRLRSLQRARGVRGAPNRPAGPARASVAATAAPQSPARAKRAAPRVLTRVQSRVRYLAEGTRSAPPSRRRAQTPPPRRQPPPRRASNKKKASRRGADKSVSRPTTYK